MARRRNKLRSNQPVVARLKSEADASAAGPARMPMRRRGIYLLPNLFTTAALFCGFYAIVQAMNQRFDYAGAAIFVAMVLDALDGRVARLTNTQSEFGAEFDSLADMVSFGAAPALVVYEWALRGMDKLGWIAAFIYVAGAALRLARFNTNIAIVDKRFFQGLPSPAAAAVVAGFVWVMNDYGIPGAEVHWFAWVAAVYAGVTMVSNVPFYSFKNINLRKSVPFIFVFLIALLFTLVSVNPPTVLFGLFCIYGLSGYVLYVWRWRQGKPVSIISTEPEPLSGVSAKQLDDDASGR